MQCQLNGVSVNDMPKFLVKNPMVNDHTVIILSNTDDSSLLIPLMLHGITSYFPVRAVTLSEYKSDVIPKFHLTAEAQMWDPSLSSYSLQEECMLNFRGQIVSTVTSTRGQITMQVNATSSSLVTSYCVVDATENDNFGIHLDRFPLLVPAGWQLSIMTSLQSIGAFPWTVQRSQYNVLPSAVSIQ